MRAQYFPLRATTIALLAVLSLAACDKKQDDRTVGQKIDSAADKVEQKTDKAVAEIKSETSEARESTSKALDTVGAKIEDAAITTAVKAELAKDSSLSALKINVDTTNGRVSLHGTAPNAAAREHATDLAKAVKGVVSVDNQLQIGA